MKTPDITPAQLAALLTFIVGQAVAAGLISNHAEKLAVSIGSIAIAAAWKIADAIIRNGRARTAAAAVTAQPPQQV